MITIARLIAVMQQNDGLIMTLTRTPSSLEHDAPVD